MTTRGLTIPKMQPELRAEVEKIASARGCPMSDVVVEILAIHFKKRRLAKIPRQKQGRKKKIAVAAIA